MAQIINYNEAKKKVLDEKVNKTKNERCNDILKNLKEKREDFNTEIITRTAEDILKALGFYNKRMSTPIIKISEAFGVKPYKVSPNDNNIEGQLFINGTTKDLYGQDKVIVVNKKNDLYFNRFVVARQLAVFLFNFKEKEEYKDKKNVFIDTYYSEEYCKNYERFATEILMPIKMFVKQYNIAVEEFHNHMFIIIYLSRYFEVPEYLVERRIYELTH